LPLGPEQRELAVGLVEEPLDQLEVARRMLEYAVADHEGGLDPPGQEARFHLIAAVDRQWWIVRRGPSWAVKSESGCPRDLRASISAWHNASIIAAWAAAVRSSCGSPTPGARAKPAISNESVRGSPQHHRRPVGCDRRPLSARFNLMV